MKVGKSIVFDGKMGMRKFWSVALPFGKVACAVKCVLITYKRKVLKLSRFSEQLYYKISLNILDVVNPDS